MKRVFTTILAIVAVLLPLSLFAKDEKTHEGIVVISYNIRNASSQDGTNSWQYRYPASALMIDDQDADVVGIQEALSSQINYFATAFGKDFKTIGVGAEDGKKEGEFSAIMYKTKTIAPGKSGWFWISETPDTPSRSWEAEKKSCATWAVLKEKATGNKFFFVCVRLDSQSEAAREKGIALLVSKIEELNTGNLPVIIAGDLNVEPSSSLLAPLKAVLSDARATAVVSDDVESFNGWGKVKKTVDYIWYKGVSCTKFETVTEPYYERTFISDHYPVKASFVF